jgi:hypothetical protein
LMMSGTKPAAMPINGFICPSLAVVPLIATVPTCNNPPASVVV